MSWDSEQFINIWNFEYFYNWIYWTGIPLVISNTQEFLYIHTFIVKFIVFFVLSYFYRNTYIQYYKMNKVAHLVQIPQVVNSLKFGQLQRHYCCKADYIWIPNVLRNNIIPCLPIKIKGLAFSRKWADVNNIYRKKFLNFP